MPAPIGRNGPCFSSWPALQPSSSRKACWRRPASLLSPGYRACDTPPRCDPALCPGAALVFGPLPRAQGSRPSRQRLHIERPRPAPFGQGAPSEWAHQQPRRPLPGPPPPTGHHRRGQEPALQGIGHAVRALPGDLLPRNDLPPQTAASEGSSSFGELCSLLDAGSR